MQKFKTHGSAQRVVSIPSAVCNTFAVQRHLVSRPSHRVFRREAFDVWSAATAAAQERLILRPCARLAFSCQDRIQPKREFSALAHEACSSQFHDTFSDEVVRPESRCACAKVISERSSESG